MEKLAKISPEVLSRLKSQEYEEYTFLKKRKDFYYSFFRWSLFLSSFISYVSIVILILGFISSRASVCIGIALFYFLLLFYIWWDEGEFDKILDATFEYFYRKTNEAINLEILESNFRLLEKQVQQEKREHEKRNEEVAIKMLEEVEKDAQKRLIESGQIISTLKYKRKWRTEYAKFINILDCNYEANRADISNIQQNLPFIKIDINKKSHFDHLRMKLAYSNADSSWLSRKLSGLPDWLPPSRTLSLFRDNPVTEAIDTLHVDPESTSETNIKIREINDNKSKSKKRISSHKTQEQQVVGVASSDINLTLKNHDALPDKKLPRHQRIIKASPEFYQRIADMKIELGRAGELLILNYENERLLSKGLNPAEYLEHSSIEIGDGLGYDICSFENGKEMYIEVKTTKGSFWTTLLFTQTEYDVMKEYQEQYYLYRLCDFDAETNFWNLYIFNGKEMLETYFDFAPNVYLLTKKSS